MSQLKKNTAGLDALIFKASTLPDAGGGSDMSAVPLNDVCYIDYDGTFLYSYSASEFVNLSAAPALPTHNGLICQGWNWDFTEAQAHVAKYGKLLVGANYITDNGRTRIYITLQEKRLEPYLGIGVNGTCVIHWGDGTSDTISGTSVSTTRSVQHIYTDPGDYVIELEVTNGTIRFNGNSTYGSTVLWKNTTSTYFNRCYQGAIKKIEIGNGMTSIGSYAFFGCYPLKTISIPDTITNIGGSAFRYACCLRSVVIPDGVTSIGDYTFRFACSLAFVSMPNSVTKINSLVFQYCYALESVTIPSKVTSIGSDLFYECVALSSVIIPDGVTTIGSNAFRNCHSLVTATIPDSVSSIGESAFYSCYCIASAKIPNGVTKVNASIYYDCYSVTNITIPSSVTTISTNAFTCNGVAEIHFKATTPPTLSGSNSFLKIPTDCIIYVPAGSLDAYTSATNYPDPATYTYMEE